MESIYEALTDRLDSLAPVEVIYGNYVEDIDPEEGWKIEANFFSNAPRGQGLKDGVMDQGRFILGAVFPKGVGVFKPLEGASLLKAIFPKGWIGFKNGFRVKIDSAPYAGAPLITPTKYTVPVTVEWTS